MLINHSIRLSTVIGGLWKKFVLVVLTCSVTNVAHQYLTDYYFVMPTVITGVLGTAIAFFLGFNNNQAYGRWWEARIIWGGLVNDSRSWARQVLHYTSPAGTYDEKRLEEKRDTLVRRHIGFLYALKDNLRNTDEKVYRQYLTSEETESIERHSNKHNAILEYQSADLEALYKAGVVDGFRFMQFNEMIVRFCDGMGKSERIKNTVFPTLYIRYTLLYVWIFIICVTLVFVETTAAWSIPIGSAVGLIFVTTHHIGVLLLNPFDHNITGVPLDQITRTIEINLLEMLGEEDIPEPVKPVDGDYVM